MNKNVVAISIEKIQRYIYSVLDDRDVVVQKDSMTLNSIIAASNTVSKKIDNIINSRFSIKKADEILRISGEMIFTTEKCEKEILNILDEIFKEIYLKYSGKIFLNYIIFRYKDTCKKIDIIKGSIKQLKKNKSKTNIIFRNNDILFKISEVKKVDIEYKEGLPDYKNIYVDNMDLLVDYKNTEENGTNGKIAIIKADLNNLGQFFMESKDYEEYSKISNYLKKIISLKYLAKKLKEGNLSGKVLPIYVAGDDIFYAVKIDAILQTVEMLKNIVEEMNDRLKSISTQNNIGLSLAVGCVFVNNHQPVRYYRDEVEEQLSKIKTEMKVKKSSQKAVLGLRILDNEFYFYKKGVQGENDLNRFIKEFYDLKFLMYEGILTNSFIYKLIYNIENVNDIKNKNNEKILMNLVLHYLRPVIGLSEKSIYEMILKHYFLNMLLKDNKTKRYTKVNHEERKFLASNVNDKLLPMLKLIAMLLDEKYYSDLSKEDKYEYKGNIFKVDDIKSNLFNKPLNYLSENSTELTKIFLGKEKKGEKTLYTKINIDKGTLFKCKKLMDRGKRDLIYNVIENSLKIKKNKESDDNLLKSKYIKDVSVEKNRINHLINNAENDWIDEVIVYYEYLEQRKEYLINTDYKKELKKYNAKNLNKNSKKQ